MFSQLFAQMFIDCCSVYNAGHDYDLSLDTRIPKVLALGLNFLKTIFALTLGCLKGIIVCVITKLMKLNWFEKCHKLNSNFHQWKYCDLNVEVHKVRKPFVIRFKNKYKLNF